MDNPMLAAPLEPRNTDQTDHHERAHTPELVGSNETLLISPIRRLQAKMEGRMSYDEARALDDEVGYSLPTSTWN